MTATQVELVKHTGNIFTNILSNCIRTLLLRDVTDPRFKKFSNVFKNKVKKK